MIMLGLCLGASVIAEPAVRMVLIMPDSSQVHVRVVPNHIESYLDSITIVFADSGYMDAHWTIVESEIPDTTGEEILRVSFTKGNLSRLTKVRFQDLTLTKPQILEREYFFLSDSGLLISEVPEAENRLMQTGLVSINQIGIFQDNTIQPSRKIIVYQATETNSVQFDGVVGAENDPAADSIRWVGSIHLDLPNITGTGRRVRLDWERTRTDAEKLKVDYTEPWIWNYPISGTIGFGREVVNGNYITRRLNLDFNWRVSSWQRIILGWEQTQNTLTYNGINADNAWENARRQTLGLGFKLLPPDNLTNALFGVHLLYHTEISRRSNAIQEMTFRALARKPLYKQLRYTGRMAFSMYQNGDALKDPSLLRPIGGTRSVRGFFEDQYRGTTTIALENDLAIGVGKNSRVFIFNDFGWLQRPENEMSMIGYGFGARVETNIGPIVFTLGKNKDLPWRNALIHIQLAGIDRRWIEN